jgi:hypothetical protein
MIFTLYLLIYIQNTARPLSNAEYGSRLNIELLGRLNSRVVDHGVRTCEVVRRSTSSLAIIHHDRNRMLLTCLHNQQT